MNQLAYSQGIGAECKEPTGSYDDTYEAMADLQPASQVQI